MKKILYIGNNLSIHGKNSTSIETLGKLLEDENFIMYYASSKKNKIIRLLDMIFQTLKYRKKVDYVLIDVYSTQNFWYAFIISQICRLLNLKYIPKLHGGNLPNRFKNNLKLCKMILNHSSANIVPSGYLEHECKKHFFKNILFIPNTIEINNYSFKNRAIKTPKLLWVRSFDEIYNPLMAIRVFKKIKSIYPEAELCMVGPEIDTSFEKCKTYCKTNNLEVKFTGKLMKPDWIELSKEYTIFINTTRIDNMPISIVEAMALGLSIISTNVGGLPYFLNDKNATLVNDNDDDAMVDAIIKTVERQEENENKINNARKLVEQYDWEIVKHDWINLLK